jgi:hypothetical protein
MGTLIESRSGIEIPPYTRNDYKINFDGAKPGTETNGSLIGTKSSWISFSTAGQCAIKLLCANSATTGDFATLRIRARNDSASGGLNGTATAGNFSASAGVNNFGNIYAVQGYAQANAYTNTDASNIVCGVYSCIDATTTSSGRRWSTWIDDHSTTKAAGGHYLLRMSDNGSTAKDGAITVYNGGRLPVLFNFEDAAGFLTDSGSPGTTAAGYIAVKTPAGTKYISLFTA